MKNTRNILIAIAVLGVAYFGVQFALQGFNLKRHESTIIYQTENCGNFSIVVRQNISRNSLEGNSQSLTIDYVQGERDELLRYINLPVNGSNNSLVSRTPITLKQEFILKPNNSGLDTYRINIGIPPSKFTEEEFRKIGSCMQDNLSAISQTLTKAYEGWGSYYLTPASINYTETQNL